MSITKKFFTIRIGCLYEIWFRPPITNYIVPPIIVMAVIGLATGSELKQLVVSATKDETRVDPSAHRIRTCLFD